MLLNYLYANFYETSLFVDKSGLTSDFLSHSVQKQTMPKASYQFNTVSTVSSFVCDHREEQIYQFHLKGHIQWLQTLHHLGLDTQSRARQHFQAGYNQTADLFFSSDLGTQMQEVWPQFSDQFDVAKFEQTWLHFLNGVYGVCTRDGSPQNIFLKQAYALFIDYARDTWTPDVISKGHRKIMLSVVNLLDNVESEFAAHEVSETSRQRCILNVRDKYS